MPRSGEALFLEELGKAAEGEIDPLFEELYRWYAAHPEAGIPAETYRKAAFLRCADGVIGRSAASALYGDTLKTVRHGWKSMRHVRLPTLWSSDSRSAIGISMN